MRLAVNATILDHRPSGLGVYTANVVRELAARERDVLVFASVRPPGLARDRLRRVSGIVSPARGAAGHLARLLWLQTRFLVALRAGRRELAFSTCPEGMLWPVVPQVCVVHDLIALRFPSSFPRLGVYFRRVLPAVLRRSRAIIVDSEATRLDLKSLLGIAGDHVSVVPASHDGDVFHADVDPTAVRRRYGVERYVLYVGNVLPHKDVVGLVRAFAAVAREVPHQLLIVGFRDPRYWPAIATEVERLGIGHRVVAPDYVPAGDLPALYAGAEAYVQPSRYEGFGLTLLEAMACGAPVIATRAGALPEVGGDAAVWVEPGAEEALSRALVRVVGDRDVRARLRERGLERAKQFSWAATGDRVVGVLRDAARQR